MARFLYEFSQLAFFFFFNMASQVSKPGVQAEFPFVSLPCAQPCTTDVASAVSSLSWLLGFLQ